jgi:RNA polymerase sigma-70 factor (ECF subfamily)
MALLPDNCQRPRHADWFTTTHWSVVRLAGEQNSNEADAALAKLCQTYWYPLYGYVRRLGHGPEDEQDLMQEFFARLLEKRYLAAADEKKGKFRSFLLIVLQRFLANEYKRASRQKRGGGQKLISIDEEDSEGRFLAEPATDSTPEKEFARSWAMIVLDTRPSVAVVTTSPAASLRLSRAAADTVWMGFEAAAQ